MSRPLFPFDLRQSQLLCKMRKGFEKANAALQELERVYPDAYWEIWEHFTEAHSPHYAVKIGIEACDELLLQHNKHAMQSLKRKKRRKAT